MLSDEEMRKINDEWDKAREQAKALREDIKPDLANALYILNECLCKVTAQFFSLEYWTRKDDIKALNQIVCCLNDYLETGNCNSRINSSLCNLYVMDKATRHIWRVGEGDHDSLTTIFGFVDYYNLQCGDGGAVEDQDGYGYVLLKTEHGFLFDEYGIIDKRFVKEIMQYLKEEGEDISNLDENGNYIRDDKE